MILILGFLIGFLFGITYNLVPEFLAFAKRKLNEDKY